MECPPKKSKMNIDRDFPQLNKKELNRWLRTTSLCWTAELRKKLKMNK